MVKISAFKSLRPIQKLAPKVPTKAYGEYSKEEIQKEKEKNKYSFLNILNHKKEKNLDKRFKIIRDKIIEFKNKNIFKIEQQESLYVYKQLFKNIEFTGFICAIDLNDYKKKNIKIHEKTIKKRELLFAKYLSTTQIHAEPVLITYDSEKNYIQKKHMSKKNQLYNFKTKDGTQHKVWKIANTKEVENIITEFKKIKHLYIADGHHRMASSLKGSKNKKCLAYIVQKRELKTYAFHRVLKSNNSNTLKKLIHLAKIKNPEKPNLLSNKIQFYVNKNWYIIEKKEKNQLIVNKLLQNVLKPIFNIKDERANKKIQFIPGNKSINSILKKLKSNEIFFLMKKIEIDNIIEIANKNETTPPKSTFILPKLPSGLIMMKTE